MEYRFGCSTASLMLHLAAGWRVGQIDGWKLTALTCADHGRTVAETATDRPQTVSDHAAPDPESSCP